MTCKATAVRRTCSRAERYRVDIHGWLSSSEIARREEQQPSMHISVWLFNDDLYLSMTEHRDSHTCIDWLVVRRSRNRVTSNSNNWSLESIVRATDIDRDRRLSDDDRITGLCSLRRSSTNPCWHWHWGNHVDGTSLRASCEHDARCSFQSLNTRVVVADERQCRVRRIFPKDRDPCMDWSNHRIDRRD